MKQQSPTPEDNAVLTLTSDGERELREPGTMLAPAELEALVLIDGRATLAQVVKRARSAAPDALRASLHALIDRNLVRVLTQPAGDVIDAGDFFSAAVPRTATPEAGAQLHAEADAEFLHRNGYCVNMARRAGAERKRTDGRNLTVLVIDDDPEIGGLLRKYLKLEGLDTRTAANRDEIVAAFRRSPLPDLVLLDLGLADVNGFDVLVKLRQHPVLRELAVIILTGTATREAVLEGIMAGADGHITKPFQIHALVRAVKAVLGLKYDSSGQDWDLSL